MSLKMFVSILVLGAYTATGVTMDQGNFRSEEKRANYDWYQRQQEALLERTPFHESYTNHLATLTADFRDSYGNSLRKLALALPGLQRRATRLAAHDEVIQEETEQRTERKLQMQRDRRDRDEKRQN